MAHRIQLAVVTTFLVAACGLDVVGVADRDASVDVTGDGSPTPPASSEGGVGAVPSAPPNCEVDACEGLALAEPGWLPVAFGGDNTAACPSGFDTADVIEDPSVKNGSCACEPCITQGTTCSDGTMQSSWSAGPGACDQPGAATYVRSGECHQNYNGSWISTYASEAAPAPKVGSCRAPGVGLRDQVTADARRICTRRADTCVEALCALPTSMTACLAAPGDVACPRGLSKRHVVANDVAMTCADCTCTATAVCGGALTWWRSSSSCAGTPTGTINAAQCVQVNQSQIGSFRWDGTVASESCTPPKPAARATLEPVGAQTVCCPR